MASEGKENMLKIPGFKEVEQGSQRESSIERPVVLLFGIVFGVCLVMLYSSTSQAPGGCNTYLMSRGPVYQITHEAALKSSDAGVDQSGTEDGIQDVIKVPTSLEEVRSVMLRNGDRFNVNQVRRWVDNGLKIEDLNDNKNRTLLLLAIHEGYPDVVRYLVEEKGQDIHEGYNLTCSVALDFAKRVLRWRPMGSRRSKIHKWEQIITYLKTRNPRQYCRPCYPGAPCVSEWAT